MYSVHLIDSAGRGSYLSVKDRMSWKTKAVAVKHANDIRALVAKGKAPWDVVAVDVEDENGRIVA